MIFACCVAGNALSVLTADKLPGNVLGMILLFVLLLVGALRLSHVENVADFFLENMAFFFLPACLSILDVFPEIKAKLLPILFVVLATTLITAAATAATVHLVLRLQTKTHAARKGAPQ